jgi:mannose-P-dolichol utilization defect protein 1
MIFYVKLLSFIVILSRVPQIYTNFANKSTGQLAFFTFFLSFAGIVARLGTVLVETEDKMLLLQTLSSTALNGILVLQFLLYWNSGKKVDDKKQKKE